MIGQGMSDSELVELLQNTLPQDLTPAQIETLRKAIRSSPGVREALMDELRLETGLASRLAPDHMGAEEFVEKIANLAAERSRTKWIWLSAMFILVGGIVIGGVGIAWNFANKPDPQLAINDKDSIKDGSLTKDGQPLDDDKNPKTLTTGTGDKLVPDDGKNSKQPEVEPVKPLSALPLPPFSPTWKLFDDASARGDRRWASRLGEIIRPMTGARITNNDREGDFVIGGRFEMLPPNADGRTIRLRFSDTRRMRLNFWGETLGARVELNDDRQLRGYTLTRGAPVKANPHNLPVGTDERFYRKNVVSRIDQTIDFDWAEGAPAPGVDINQFAVRWEGVIKIATAGKYRFLASSDDGVMVTVAGKRIVEDFVPRAFNTSVGEIELPAGEHDILVEYFDDSSLSKIKLEWEGPNIKRQVIPSTVLRTARQEGRVPGLKARYFSGPEVEAVGVDLARFVSEDNARFRMMREGGLDIRYQDGHVVIARGDVVLLTVPMAQAPREVTMETEGRLWLAEELRFKPLVLDKAADSSPLAEKRKASELSWRVMPEDREKVTTMTAGDDGSVTFARSDAKSNHDFRYASTIEMLSGAEVTLEVSGMTPGTALFFTSPIDNNTMMIALGAHRGQNVLCYSANDRGDVERRYREGWTVDDRFWVRARFNIDGTRLFASNDGKHFKTFEYRELEGAKSPAREAVFGMLGHYEVGDRKATIHTVSLQRFGAIEQLADPAVLAMVPALKDDVISKLSSYDSAYAQASENKPAQVGDAAWRVACNVAMLRQPLRVSIRQQAAFDAIRAATLAQVRVEKISAALCEIPNFLAMGKEDYRSTSYPQLLKLYDDLAMNLWVRGQRDQLGRLLDDFYTIGDLGHHLRWYTPKQTAPGILTRLHLFHLWDRARFDDLRQSAMRYEFFTRQSHPWIDKSSDDYPVRMLCAWMVAQASEQLADVVQEGEADRHGDRQLPRRFAPHPLIVDSDRESMNTVSEFLAAVESKAFDHACRILTRHSLPDGIAPVDNEGRLFKATYVLLRDIIESNEQLADRIKKQYAAVGLIRLRQALDQGRLDALEALATQFHGTEASRQALNHLADRDLSMGNFFSAAARYDALMEQAIESDKPTIAAKRRLSLAMAGEDAGKVVTQPVQLGNEKLSPGDFEQLVSSLLDERRKSGFMPDNMRPEEQEAFAPRAVKLSTAMDLTAARDLPERAGHRIREITYAHKDGVLLVHQHAKLTAYDLVGRRMLWQKSESGRDLSSYSAEPATPLIHGSRVYVPFFREKRTELTCFDLHKGEVIWRQVFDDAFAGDPIAIGPWLYVFSVRREVGNYGDIILRRLAPETGESVMARRVVRVRYGEELFRMGRPQLVSDALVFRAGSSLVSCDLLGSPRWIRRLSLVPPTVDSPLFDFQAMSDFVVDEDRIVVTAPGSPHVVCISARTGEQIWSYLQPRVRRMVARRGDNVIIATVNHLEALDIKSGKLVWQSPLMADYDAVLPAGTDMIVTLTLEKVESIKTDSDRRARQMEWVSAVDGQVVKSVTIEELSKEVFDIESLFTDGKVIVGVSNVNIKSKGNGKLVVLEGK